MAVHQIIDYIKIPAPQHSLDALYLVCYGNVDWNQNGNTRPAIFVLMQYGDEIAYRRVAHILTTPNEEDELSDFDKILAAMQKLKNRHNLN